MNLERSPRSLVLRCDPEGVVREILTSDFQLPSHLLVDHPFDTILDPTSQVKGLALLDAVRREQAVSGWELLVQEPARRIVLTFAAAKLEREILVVGSETAAACRDALADVVARRAGSQALPARVQRAFGRLEERAEQDFNYLTELNNELTNAHRELAKANAELAKTNEQKNRLLGAAAHDLRSPLSVIAGYTRMLRRRVADRLDERERQILEMIEHSSKYMSELVAELIAVAELDSVELRLTPEQIGLTALVERITASHAAIAEQKNITVVFQRPANDVQVLADTAKLSQVLHNLLSNAIKFSPAGGRVEVSMEPKEAEILIAVADQGPGIASEDRSALFRPFARTRNKPTGGETSTGLGLWIARRIVEGHRGRIWLDGRPGGGSVFRFALPFEGANCPATRGCQ